MSDSDKPDDKSPKSDDKAAVKSTEVSAGDGGKAESKDAFSRRSGRRACFWAIGLFCFHEYCDGCW